MSNIRKEQLNILQAYWRKVDYTATGGSSSTTIAAATINASAITDTSSGNATSTPPVRGVVTAGTGNLVKLRNNNNGNPFIDDDGYSVYGRITFSTPNYVVTYYKISDGSETATTLPGSGSVSVEMIFPEVLRASEVPGDAQLVDEGGFAGGGGSSSGGGEGGGETLAETLALGNSANNLKITDLGAPTSAQDAATKAYVDSVATGGGSGVLGLAAVLDVSNSTDGYDILLSNGSDIIFENTASAPSIRQQDKTTNEAGGEALTIRAQNATGTTSTGGNLELYAGEGTNSGGSLVLEGGLGNVTGGSVFIRSGPGFNVGATSGNITLDVANSNGGTNGQIRLAIDSSNKVVIDNEITLFNPDLIFGSAVSEPSIFQDDEDSTSGEALTIHAQNTTAENATGGNLELYAGEGDGYGGNLVMEAGIGQITGGSVFLRSGPGTNSGATSGNITLDVANSNSGTNGEIRLAIDGTNKLTIGTSAITISSSSILFPASLSNPTISQATQTTDEISGKPITIISQTATGTETQGGAIRLFAGNGVSQGGGISLLGGQGSAGGSVSISGGSGTGGDIGGVINISAGDCAGGEGGSVNIDTGNGTIRGVMSFSIGGFFVLTLQRDFTLLIGESESEPATPDEGGVLYVEDGALKYKGSGGTVTPIANA